MDSLPCTNSIWISCLDRPIYLMGMSWRKAECMNLWRHWIEVHPFSSSIYFLVDLNLPFCRYSDQDWLVSVSLIFHTESCHVCSHVDDMVGTSVVPFSTLNNFLGIASWRFGCCFTELPLYWKFSCLPC